MENPKIDTHAVKMMCWASTAITETPQFKLISIDGTFESTILTFNSGVRRKGLFLLSCETLKVYNHSLIFVMPQLFYSLQSTYL